MGGREERKGREGEGREGMGGVEVMLMILAQ